MSVRDRMLALLEEELPREFTVSVGAYAFDVSLDTESEYGDRRWSPKFVTGHVSYDDMPGSGQSGFANDDDHVESAVLRLIGKKIGTDKVRWDEGEWAQNRAAPSVFGSKTMTRHFSTNKKKAPSR
jgi:hypothetical protein